MNGDGIPAVVATAKAGVLGAAKQIPGTVALSTGPGAVFLTADALSCPAAGNCLVGGSYFDKSSLMQVYVAGEVGGTWHKAVPVPGLAKLNTGGTRSSSRRRAPRPATARSQAATRRASCMALRICRRHSSPPKSAAPGTYQVVATYPGSSPFRSSASAASVLTVA
jgi:hypothetical protein